MSWTVLVDFRSPLPLLLIFIAVHLLYGRFNPSSPVFIFLASIAALSSFFGPVKLFAIRTTQDSRSWNAEAIAKSRSSNQSWRPHGWAETFEDDAKYIYVKLWNKLARQFPHHQLVGTQFGLDIIKWAHAEKQLISTADPAVLDPRQPSHIMWTSKQTARQKLHARTTLGNNVTPEKRTSNALELELKSGSFEPEPIDLTLILDYRGTNIFLHYCQWPANGRKMMAWFAHFAGTSDQIGRDFFAEVFCWQNLLRNEIWLYDEHFTKSKALYEDVMSSNAEELVLPEETLTRLRRDTKTFFESQSIFESLQVPWKRGILLMGPPGNGKTATIKAIIKDSIETATVLYARRLKSLRAGTSAAINDVFKHAREHAPCLLIFEDLDSLVEESARSVLLNQLDGLNSNEGILIIATTNHASKLDDALLNRPSRFDQKYSFDLPNEEMRGKFIEKWLRERVGLGRLVYDGASDAGVDIKNAEELIAVMVKRTEGWSFAFLKELFLCFLLRVAIRRTVDGDITPAAWTEESLDRSEAIPQQKDEKISVPIILDQLRELGVQVNV
ncbi:hypothetical protein OC846_003976 [Tilletia horrida]|uniref:AAA+ ATPase domain-containing protein n=1 Tax=Tilletia horrida TaxID=155126 RepID=A0AAN6GRI2_9BASI|nr:hypothetical protein OC845_003998 [Tilletia horrida]KAK0549670.1 hypothetical protein OC846_003976 [Tilletia horrida]KAK0564792.1 hypothetical protein OC861_004087 [Tilletia horrida]